MRECLGWITNCENRQGCPQNWLEVSASELPIEVPCHVCGSNIGLVISEEELVARANKKGVGAFPVVPCTGVAGIQRAATAQNSARPNGNERRAPGASAGNTRAWFCMLQNGEAIKLDKDTMIIGRSRTCDIVIPSAKVSRQHASLSRVNEEYFIEDLGSANGVWRSGEKITRTKVGIGDVFTISDETLTFEQR